MNRRNFLTTIGQTTVGAICAGFIASTTNARSKQPNILMVIGDDMTWRDCEPYGNKDVRTPNMARLAEEGVCFDNMFTSTAMCAPTRQQLYTGLYPVRNGAYPNHSRVYDGVKGIPIYYKDLGYRVGLIGKEHFKLQKSFPFEILGNRGKKDEASNTKAIAEFVNRDNNQPYFLIAASNEPHTPWDSGDASGYDPDSLTIPPHLVDCKRTRDDLTKYYAEITYLDGQLGNCMRIVDESGQRENTAIIFTSEQGSSLPFGKWTCYDIGLKTAFIVRWPEMVKPGTRNKAMTQYVDVVPTLLEAAGANPSRMDAGRPDGDGNRGFDGKSFFGVLSGKKNEHRKFVYGVHTTRGIINGSANYPVRSVRSKTHKFIWNLNYKTTFYNAPATRENSILTDWIEQTDNDPRVVERVRFYQNRPEEELYDIVNDPYELNNLADKPELQQVKAELKARLLDWMAQQNDKGIDTEAKANERQGKNGRPDWKPYRPD